MGRPRPSLVRRSGAEEATLVRAKSIWQALLRHGKLCGERVGQAVGQAERCLRRAGEGHWLGFHCVLRVSLVEGSLACLPARAWVA